MSQPPPKLGRGLLLALGALFGATALGIFLSATLIAHGYPLILIALAPLPRHLILVAPQAEMWSLVLVATARSTLTCIVSYEVGVRYGPHGVRLIERQSAAIGKLVRRFEPMFIKAAPAFLIGLPGPLTSVLSGATAVGRPVAWVSSAVGHAGWASINYLLGDWLAPWTAPIVGFIQRNLLSTTIAIVLITTAYQWLARKRRIRAAELQAGSSAQRQ